MLFIFIHSAMSGDASTAESDILVLRLEDLLSMDPALITFLVRKAAHFVIYMILGVCLLLNVRDFCRSAGRTKGSAGAKRALLAWVIGTVYAATDEIHQLLVPGRNGQFYDVCLDSVGVICGVLLAAAVAAKRQKRRERSVEIRKTNNC